MKHLYFLSVVALVLLLHSALIPGANALFGNKKKKEEEAAKQARQNIQDGMDTMRMMAQDPNAFKEALQAMKDPETLKEVEKMMKDPAFVKEMERIKSDPHFLNAIETAKEVYSDPQKAARLFSDMQQYASAINQQPSDVEVGINELAKAAKNPKMLAEAMDMLKDPEVAAEVKAMMEDPSFQAEMKRITENPNFKAAMEKAAKDVEAIQNDPVRMQKLKAEAKAAGLI